jgi:hypothetical protein
MATFKIHFFKEKSRMIDIEHLIAFFESRDDFHVEMDEQSVRMIYEHPTLEQKALYTLTPKSTVPDIYRLSPRYLDVNFQFEVPILSPNMVVYEHFKWIEQLCRTFHFYVYHPLFEDVLPYREDILKEVYKLVKDAYRDKHPELMSQYVALDSTMMYAMLSYQGHIEAIQSHLGSENVTPGYMLKKTERELLVGIKVIEGQQVVLPPYLNTIFLFHDTQVTIYHITPVMPQLLKLLQKVPGAIEGTMMLSKKTTPKFYKLLKKIKPLQLKEGLESISIKQLID